MSEYGRIIAAGIDVDGSDMRVDHAAGVSVLDLEDALSFFEPEAGETIQVRIIADDDTEELVTIKIPETEDEDTVDDIDGFLYLAAPTVNAYSEGSRVEVYPETKRLVAQVRLDDAEEDSETVDAIVDASLYEKVPEGSDLDMAVELSYDGEAFYVVNILGEEPTMEIVAGTFTGGLVRTAASGRRIEISATDNDRIKFYNSDTVTEAGNVHTPNDFDLTIQVPDKTNGQIRFHVGGLINPYILQIDEQGLRLNAAGTQSARILVGSGSPEGNVTATPGSLFLRIDPAGPGSIVYGKQTGTGNTGWVAGGGW